MQIIVNGKKEDINNEITIKELLESLEVKMLQYVSVQINDEIIPINEFQSKTIKENDNVEFLYFMGGGQKL